MNPWLQTKRYECPACGVTYLHDKSYRHASFECSRRAAIVQGVGGRPVPTTMPGCRVRPPTLGMAAPIFTKRTVTVGAELS
jgi:hypothetical protein